MSESEKQRAQQRIDEIAGFEAELERLASAGVLVLDEPQCQAVADYHRDVRQHLQQHHDVDLSSGAKSLSLGMQVVSFLGAWALAASVFFLFHQYWGYLASGWQVLVLISASVLSLGLTALVWRRDDTGYFAKLAALIAFSCFVLNITMLGQIFNLRPSPGALLVFAFYGLLLAYRLHIRLLLATAILCLFAYIGAQTATWGGGYWLSLGERPENFLLPALALFWLPSLVSQQRYHGFTAIYRQLSLIAFFITLLVMSNWGQASYLPWRAPVIEGWYQLAGFAASAGVIWLAMTRGWPAVMVTGNVFFSLFLFTKFFDWWWQWLPKYLFFFLMGMTAILALLIFSRLRRAMQLAGGSDA